MGRPQSGAITQGFPDAHNNLGLLYSSTLAIVALLLVGSAALAQAYLPAPTSAVSLRVPLAKGQR